MTEKRTSMKYKNSAEKGFRIRSVLIFCTLILFFSDIVSVFPSCRADELTFRICLETENLKIFQNRGFDRLNLDGCEESGIPGEPLLPAKTVAFVIPAGATDVRINVYPKAETIIQGEHDIQPAPVLRPLFESDLPQIIFRNGNIYSSNETYPQNILLGTHIGRVAGFTIASCTIQPWKYIPAEKEISLYTEIEITVEWTPGQPRMLSTGQVDMARNRLASWIDNPENLYTFSPPAKPPDAADVDYLIICDSSYVSVFEPLAEYHSSNNIKTDIDGIQEILAASPGSDEPEQLRNYLKYKFENNGLIYVLLAGDETLIPARFIHTECEGWPDYAPAELYFADLDGTWDASGDGNYGQPDDDLDLYSDLLLGRALFSNTEEAEIFVNRTLIYMSSPPSGGWAEEAVLCGALLFEDIGYHTAKVNDSIAVCLPETWDIIKYYESPETRDGTDTHIAYLMDGSAWNHYAGHGTNRGIYWHKLPIAMMTNRIADSLSNGDRTGFHLSIACSPGAFHDDVCTAEKLLQNPNGGAVSVMFNTSVGWEGFWPEMGVSEWLCILTTRQVFRYGNSVIGSAFATARDQRVSQMHGGYERTLQVMMAWSAFHDPALIVHGAPDPVPPPVPLIIGNPYPNPATRDAPIAFSIDFSRYPVDCPAHVAVFDLAGRLVWRRDMQESGNVLWEGTSSDGRRVPAGVYIVSARRGEYIVSKLVTILN